MRKSSFKRFLCVVLCVRACVRVVCVYVCVVFLSLKNTVNMICGRSFQNKCLKKACVIVVCLCSDVKRCYGISVIEERPKEFFLTDELLGVVLLRHFCSTVAHCRIQCVNECTRTRGTRVQSMEERGTASCVHPHPNRSSLEPTASNCRGACSLGRQSDAGVFTGEYPADRYSFQMIISS